MSDLPDYHSLSQRLIGRPFKQPQLLETAFTHRSFLNENRQTADEHNERFEFLGDAVLELVVTEYLYRHYQEPEGVLTNWRAALVRTESLSAISHRLGFSSYLRLSHGEQQGSQRAHEQILANTFEAVLGAVYLDGGYELAAQFVADNVLVTLPAILEDGSWLDAKTQLQEQLQSQESQTPVYKVIEESGPDHDKKFVVGVYADDRLLGQGQGYSKQAAQKEAAEVALDKLSPESSDPPPRLDN